MYPEVELPWALDVFFSLQVDSAEGRCENWVDGDQLLSSNTYPTYLVGGDWK